MQSSRPAPQLTPPGPGVRAIVSMLVVLHVTAVFVGPWAMPPGRSELAAGLAGLMQPYIEALGLANGYRFFAPEPGPSHLVHYEVTRADGSHVSGVFPDRQMHWPRLLYHRHFMLSEFLNTLDANTATPERMQAYARSYAQHLLKQYDGQSVDLKLVRHYVPRMSEVRQGTKLSDKRLYEERPLVSYQPDGP